MGAVPIQRQISTLAAEHTHATRRLRDAVARGQARPSEADYVIEGLDAAIATLEWVRDHADVIKRVHAELASRAEEAS